MKESQIREHMQKGWIRCIITFEVVGKPAKHVDEALTAYIENIKKDHRIIVLAEERAPVEEADEKLFSAFSEEEVIVKNLETLTWLSINFSPASIEILEPDELVLPARDVTNWLNDLIANMHEIGASMRGHKNSADHLTIAMNQLIQNSIIMCVKYGGKNEAQISGELGIHHEQIVPFLEHMVQKKKISVQEGIYYYLPPGAIQLETPKMMMRQPAKPTDSKQSASKPTVAKTTTKSIAKKKR